MTTVAWRFTFPADRGDDRLGLAKEPSGTVICRIEDGSEARQSAEKIFGPYASDWPIIASELSDEAAAQLGIEPGTCRVF